MSGLFDITSSGGDDQREFLGALVANTSDVLFMLDADGEFVFVNAASEDILGYPSPELVDRSLSSLVPDQYREYRLVLELIFEETDVSFADETIDLPVLHADGTTRWIAASLQPHRYRGEEVFTGTIRDISHRKEREQEFERYARIIETIDDGIYILDSQFTIIDVNEAVVSMTGYPRDRLVGAHVSLLASEDTIDQAARLSAELLDTRSGATALTAEIETADGDRLPIETRFSLYPLDGGEYGHVGVIRDITERKRFEETLTALHDSTRELLTVETKPEVCQLIVDTADTVIDISTVLIYLYDPDENALRPVASSIDRELSRTVRPDEDPVWEAFVSDEETTIDAPNDSTAPIAAGTCLPIGDQGVLVVESLREDQNERDTRTLLGLLAASAEEALALVDRENDLRERDRELKHQNEALRKLDRINTIIREIDQALIRADTFEEIGNAVCDRLVMSDRFVFAWIGMLDTETDDLRPEMWDGEGLGYLEEVTPVDVDDPSEPSARAAVESEPVVAADITSDFQHEPWGKVAISCDFRSAIAVPLRHGDVLYGVLTVYADWPNAFDDLVRTVFAELGQTISNAMYAIKAKQALLTDSRVELEFRIPDADDFLHRLARETSSRITSEGFIPQSDESTRVFFTLSGTDPDVVRSAADRSVVAEDVRLVAERDEGCVFEAVVDGSTVASTFVENGADVRSITTDEDGLHVRVDLAADAEIREFVEQVSSRYPSTELTGRRDRQRPKRSEMELRSDFEDRLTDRQLEVLTVAYHSGFFEWPRNTTGEEIADSLDVSQPTVNRHLRACERKLFTMILGEEE